MKLLKISAKKLGQKIEIFVDNKTFFVEPNQTIF